MVISKYPPGPDRTVFQAILSTIRQQQDRLAYLIAINRAYGDIVHFHTGLRDIYLLVQPEYIHSVLVEQADKFYKTRPFKRALGKYLGQGLLVLDGDEHRRERRLAQPAFHHQRIEAYAAVMVSFTERLMARWRHGQTVDMAQEMMALTSSIVAKTLFDADVSHDAEVIGQSMAILQEATIIQFDPVRRLLMGLSPQQRRAENEAIRALDEIIFRIIDERRAAKIDKGDLLSMLLISAEADDQPSMQRVRDEVISLFLAGHETTANVLTWAWYLLALHPEVADKLHTEVASVLGGRAATAQDMAHLPYATMIIKETLRLYPSAWVITREAITEVEIGGYRLKAGSVAVISPYITHRHAAYYPDPLAFRPERFAAGAEQTLPRFAYFPFSGGPRVCIGQSFAMMEAVLILATIAQRFQLDLVPDQQIDIEPLITLRAKHGIRMTPVQLPNPVMA